MELRVETARGVDALILDTEQFNTQVRMHRQLAYLRGVGIGTLLTVLTITAMVLMWRLAL